MKTFFILLLTIFALSACSTVWVEYDTQQADKLIVYGTPSNQAIRASVTVHSLGIGGVKHSSKDFAIESSRLIEITK